MLLPRLALVVLVAAVDASRLEAVYTHKRQQPLASIPVLQLRGGADAAADAKEKLTSWWSRLAV